MGTVRDFEMSGKSINTCLDSLRKDRHSYRMLTKFVKDTEGKGEDDDQKTEFPAEDKE